MSYVPGTYTIMQQAFALSMWANLASPAVGDSDSLSLFLQQKILGDGKTPGKLTTYAAQVGNDWQVVWGPRAVASIRGKAINAMYVAHSPAHNLYVVAIAATNEDSFYDWFTEDFNVSTQVAFPVPGLDASGAATPAGGMVSTGTSIGVTNLMTKLTPASSKLDPINMFLTDIAKNGATKDATLIFTGHSLGGALSPTLAAQLCGSPEAQANWNQVLVLPTAGATPGNAAFAGLYTNGGAFAVPANQSGNARVTTAYGPVTANWNTLVWNQYDVVPHAWDLLNDVFQKLEGGATSIYGAVVPPLEGQLSYLMDKATAAAQAPANKDPSNAYTRLPQNLLVAPSPAPTFSPPYSSITAWATELANQHIAAYFDIFNVSEIYDPDAQSAVSRLIQEIEDLFGSLPV